jgi:hypothetical protein
VNVHQHKEVKAESTKIALHDDPQDIPPLELLYATGHRRLRNAERFGDIAIGHAGVRLQQLDDGEPEIVDFHALLTPHLLQAS